MQTCKGFLGAGDVQVIGLDTNYTDCTNDDYAK